MKTRASIALAAGLLLAATSGALAAGTSQSASPSKAAKSAADTLTLTQAQRKTAWNDLQNAGSKQNAPSSFNASVGAMVPNSINIQRVPAKLGTDVPSLAPYDFAMVQGKLLIVNPSDKKIVDIVTG